MDENFIFAKADVKSSLHYSKLTGSNPSNAIIGLLLLAVPIYKISFMDPNNTLKAIKLYKCNKSINIEVNFSKHSVM